MSAENEDSRTDGVKFARADSVKMSPERILILAHFGDNVCAKQAFVNVNVERKAALMEAMKTVRLLLKSGRPINKCDYSVKISELTKEVQVLARYVESKDLEFQTISGRALYGNRRYGSTNC